MRVSKLAVGGKLIAYQLLSFSSFYCFISAFICKLSLLRAFMNKFETIFFHANSLLSISSVFLLIFVFFPPRVPSHTLYSGERSHLESGEFVIFFSDSYYIVIEFSLRIVASIVVGIHSGLRPALLVYYCS